MPAWLAALHSIAAACGVTGTFAALLFCRRSIGGLAATVLLALIANAFIAGGLSMPHDRYQSRIVWLAVLTPILLVSHAVAQARQRTSQSSLAA